MVLFSGTFKLRRLALTIFVFLSPFVVILKQVVAQSTIKIEGSVFTIAGEPLGGANVIILGTGFGAATDAMGYFTIENLFAGEYTLQARFLGFQNGIRKGVVVQKDFVTTVDFKLQPVVLPFDEIIVEARHEGRFESDFQEIITANDIQKSSARSVGELLINVPGVDLIDEGGGSGRKTISIRGSNSNQVLVLLDGVPLNDPLVGDVDLNQISLSSVQEIRVSKGGSSSRYGSGALGGVIEIISKKHPVDEIRLKGQFGNYRAFGIQPAVSGSFKKVNYFFNFEALNEDGDYPYTYQRLDGTTVKESRLNTDFSSRNYFGKVSLDLNRHSIQFQANIYGSTRGLPGLVFSWTPYAEARTERRILIGRYALQRKNWESQLQISQHLNETEFQHNPPSDAPLRFRTVPPYHTKYRIISHRAAFESTYNIFNNHAMFFNTALQIDNFKDEDLLVGSLGPIRATDNLNYSWTLRNAWHLPKPKFLTSFILNHAIRFDYISFENSEITRSDHQISPRIGVLISQNKEWILNLKANWGKSFRVPTFADLFYQDFRVKGNPNLLPEKSWDFDVGLQFGMPWFGWLEVSGTYFRHNVENIVVWELGSFATWQPFNTDALLKGWEFGSSWDVWKNMIHLNVSHVFLNALDKSERRTTHNKKLIYRPKHTTKIGIRIEFNRIILDYYKRMVGRRYVTASNTVSMPSYTVDDLTIITKQNFKKLKINLKVSIFNFLNKKYEIVERAPLPGRYWRAGVEFIY